MKDDSCICDGSTEAYCMYCILSKRLHVHDIVHIYMYMYWLKDSKYVLLLRITYIYRKIVIAYAHCHWRPWNTSASIHAFNKLFIASIRFSEPIAHVTCSPLQCSWRQALRLIIYLYEVLLNAYVSENRRQQRMHVMHFRIIANVQSNSNDRQLLSSL